MEKKRLFYVMAILMMALTTVGFISCGDDEDDDNGGNNNGGVPVSTSALVSRLTDNNGKAVLLTAYGRHYFSYSKGGNLVGHGRTDDKDGEETFVINGLKYTNSVDRNRDGSPNIVEGSFVLNKNGFIQKATFEMTELKNPGGKVDDYWKEEYTFTYNSQNQLTEIKGPVTEKSYDSNGQLERESQSVRTITFNWSNGNLMSIVNVRVGIRTKNGVQENINDQRTHTYTYGNEKNVTKQHFVDEFSSDWDEAGLEGLALIGLMGVGPADLPISMDGRPCSFTLNANGTIATDESDGSVKQYQYQ